MKAKLFVLLLSAAGASAVAQPPAAPAPAAPAGGNLASKLINIPGTVWTVYGSGQTSTRLETAGPQNYPMVRATITQKGANPWDAGAVSPVAKPIAAGDTVLIAVYLRAPNATDGQPVTLPFVGLSGSAAPYATLVSDHVAITNQWKQYFVGGKAAQAAAANGAQVSVHLASAAQVVDLGPIRVFDLGPDVDPARLPKNQ
jgi:hypothetical protein